MLIALKTMRRLYAGNELVGCSLTVLKDSPEAMHYADICDESINRGLSHRWAQPPQVL